MDKRGALSLSVNLLVVIILSLVILSSGISLLYKFIEGAKELKVTLDAQTEAELKGWLLEEGKQVALGRHTVELYGGESYVFGLGILNIEKKSFGEEFRMEAGLAKYVDEKEEELTSEEMKEKTKEWLLYNPGPHIIKENEPRAEPILVEVPKDAKKGMYIFKVAVWCGGEECFDEKGEPKPYDNVKNFSVVVK